jgi:hypothetical protein
MRPQETLILTRYVRACCPQQAMDRYTPDAWHELLGDLSLEDCKQAVTAVARRQPFVAPAEIRAEVRRIREERIARSVIPAPPAELTDDPERYQAVLRAGTRLAADGDALPARGQPLAITGTPPEQRGAGQPATLRSALAELRRALGPARARSGKPVDPQAVAAEQVAEARRRRGEDEGAA